MSSEIDVLDDNGDWLDLIAILETHPEFVMRILDMGDAVQGGRLLSKYNVSEEEIVDMLDESMGGGHFRGYLEEKAMLFRGRERSLAGGARNRESFKVVRWCSEKIISGLKSRWGNNAGQGRKWRT